MSDYLYKFKQFTTRNLVSLQKNKIYFANPDTFNDPFDCSIRPFYEKESLKDYIADFKPAVKATKDYDDKNAIEYITKRYNENVAELKIEMLGLFIKVVLRQFGVFSLSENNDDLLMWAHYADSHKGYCIEFDRTKDHCFREVKKVNYPNDNKYPHIQWPKDSNEMMGIAEKIILTKAKHWFYEKEWRVINRPNNLTDNYIGHERSYAPESLRSIIFGAKMENKYRDLIKSVTSDLSVEYKESVISGTEFKVIIQPC